MKRLDESFDEMDAAYEVASIIIKKHGKNPSQEIIKEEINKWLKESGWQGDLDSEWIYNFVIEDVGDEIGLFESKKLKTEGLSSDKEAFLVLDKLAQDLKKIYDEDGKGYKIHEQDRLNKATDDLIEMQIDFAVIKDLIHWTAQNVYERKYTQEDLLEKIDEMKFKYSNVLNQADKEKERESKKESLLKEDVGSSEELSDILNKLKQSGYLSFDTMYQTNNGSVYISYQDYDEDMNSRNTKNLRQRYLHDLNLLKQHDADIEEEETGFDEDNNIYTIGIYYEV